MENCFVQGQTENTIEKNILHSVDSGNHTCTVTDDVGNTGSATYEVRVTGMCSTEFQGQIPLTQT